MILKFGKYRGMPIEDVPTEYLEWMLDTNQRMIATIEQELDRRKLSEEAELSWIEKVIRSGYRELAKKHHPDVGGSEDEMRQVVAAVEYLREISTQPPTSTRKAS